MPTVLVQAGHKYPREPKGNLPAQTGTAGEIELVSAIQAALVRRLERDRRFRAIAVPGDIPDGIRVDAALFLHADGAASAAARGFSFGYPQHPVNQKLADLLRAEFLALPGHPPVRANNNTVDMAHYYGFGLVSSGGPEVLVEHGFLTNPAERDWLKRHVKALARAEYRALCRYFGLTPTRGGTRRHGIPAGITPAS